MNWKKTWVLFGLTVCSFLAMMFGFIMWCVNGTPIFGRSLMVGLAVLFAACVIDTVRTEIIKPNQTEKESKSRSWLSISLLIFALLATCWDFRTHLHEGLDWVKLGVDVFFLCGIIYSLIKQIRE